MSLVIAYFVGIGVAVLAFLGGRAAHWAWRDKGSRMGYYTFAVVTILFIARLISGRA